MELKNEAMAHFLEEYTAIFFTFALAQFAFTQSILAKAILALSNRAASK
ncbi:hypothetical protein FHS24_001444 [Psychrobacter luti]|uniref:Uncharacterized protein n=1 Tax=Psychrobacter luti TaxID=198481 RepID=A0A839TC31_9GAMM|nr:hypothetical protein [Psychrobacter luti]MBB3106927.1 hypothetical protein [Psychrobacter luti]